MPPRRIWALAVIAAALAASLAGLGNELVQDDVSLLVESSRLHGLSGGRWREILTSPYWPPPHSPDLYRPLTSLVLAAEYGLGGGSPLLFRIVSYLLYAGTAVVVLGLARRILPGGEAAGAAVAAALLFAVHPVHVEAVALAVGQGELLVALFAVVTVSYYLDRRRSGVGDLRVRDWGVLTLLYLGAGLSKEQGLVLPGLLIAVELALLRGTEAWRPRWGRLAPGYGLLGAVLLVLLMARRAVLGGTVAGSFTAAALVGLDLTGRALTALAMIPRWATLLAWPLHLQADYSPQEIVASTGLGGLEGAGLLLLGGAIAAAWFARRRAPAIGFGLLWIGVALFPVSNVLIPTGIVLAERTLFLPSIGLVLVLSGAGAAIPSRTFARASRVVLALVAGALVWRSAVRQGDWRNDPVFRSRSVVDAPRSWRTQLSYASLLFEAGRRDSALDHYAWAATLAPPRERWRVRNDLAEHYFSREETALAVEQLYRSLAESPEQETTRHYLVLGLLALGAYREAAAEADSAVARGGAPAVFGELKVLADSARRLGVPAGSVKIRVRALRQ